MAWTLILLGLIFCCTSSRAQFVVTQEPSASLSPGGTVQLRCSKSSGSVTGDNYPSWYQQKLGNVPKLLVRSSGTSNQNVRPSEIPSRFAGSITGNAACLTITGAEVGDDGIYYCLLYGGSGVIFGGGTQLNVVSGETKAPTLSIFPPSTEEIDTNKATLVCQCQDFYPAALAWTWTVNDQTINTGVDSTRPTKQTDNNLFMAGSFLSINAIDWKANNMYTCKATHEGKTFQASVKQSECI